MQNIHDQPTLRGAMALLLVCSANVSADGPDYTNYPVVNECVGGLQANEETVFEGSNGRFTRYGLEGRHRFDAADVTFDGLDSNGDFVHWPIKLQADETTRYLSESGTLIEPASGGAHRKYTVELPGGLDHAHFYVAFDQADPGDMLYMKVIDPAGNATFHQRDSDGFESAMVADPVGGTWTVRASIRAGAGADVGFTVVVDDQPSAELGAGHGTVHAGGTHRYHDVYVPAGTALAHFYTSFSVADPDDELYMKLTDPNGNATFYSHPTNSYESAVIDSPIAGTWEVRVASSSTATVDARYALTVDDDVGEHASGCWYGGTIMGAWDETDVCGPDEEYPDCVTWEDPYHHSGVMTVEASNFLVEGINGSDHGDGLRSLGDNTVFDGVYLHDIHDDCIENDNLGDLVVTDSFLDGCYVGVSARTVRGAPPVDGGDNVVEIRNTLVRLEPQPTVYKPYKYGAGPGHGTFFKWESDEDIAVGLSLHNNIFLAEQENRHGGGLGVEEVSNLVSCSDNVMVWTGEGSFPNEAALPSCFRVTDDYQEWLDAVSAWDARHPGRLQ